MRNKQMLVAAAFVIGVCFSAVWLSYSVYPSQLIWFRNSSLLLVKSTTAKDVLSTTTQAEKTIENLNVTNDFGGLFDAQIAAARTANDGFCNRTRLCTNSTSHVLIVVQSGLAYTDRRNAVRETWLSERWLKKLGYEYVFLIGQPITLELQRECEQFGDIVVAGNFIDNYANLSFKSLEMLRLVGRDCWSQVRYLVKADDDTFVNLPTLPNVFEKIEQNAPGSATQSGFIAGAVTQGGVPHRDPKSKYHVPPSEYPRNKYPPFVHGPAYVVSIRAVRAMLRAVTSVTMIHLEDIYLALLAEASGVKVVNADGFLIGWAQNWAVMSRLVSAHGDDPGRMRNIWAGAVAAGA